MASGVLPTRFFLPVTMLEKSGVKGAMPLSIEDAIGLDIRSLLRLTY
jgi:hypothetical protein